MIDLKKAKLLCEEYGSEPQLSVFIKRNNQYIGYIELNKEDCDFDLNENECFISYICAFKNAQEESKEPNEIKDTLRLGNGKYMIKEFIKLNPQIKAIYGYTLPEKKKFWLGVGAKFKDIILWNNMQLFYLDLK